MELKRKTIRDVDVAGARVLLRVDYNVPLDSQGAITDDLRIRETIPTLRYLLERGAAVIVMSHLGRPKGKVVPSMSLRPVAVRLGELLGAPVTLAPDCVGEEVERMAAALQPGQVMLLENLRFHKEEEENDPQFAKALARLGDIYVNDAFGAAHRAHASTEGITRFTKRNVAGFLMEKELQAFHSLLAEPARPVLAILGGAKVSDKIGVLKNLLRLADGVVVGGAMANTFLMARGLPVGRSLAEPDAVELAREIEAEAKERGTRFALPTDLVVAPEIAPGACVQVVPVDAVPAEAKAGDIGPQTRTMVRQMCLEAGTVFWNGPMGVFEVEPFHEGTVATARALADATARGAVTVVGGGDSAAALQKAGLSDAVTHLSTGGGASLELVEGRELPGIAALELV